MAPLTCLSNSVIHDVDFDLETLNVKSRAQLALLGLLPRLKIELVEAIIASPDSIALMYC